MKIRFSDIAIGENFQYSRRWFRKFSERQANAFDTRDVFIFNAGDLVVKPDPDPKPDADDDYNSLGARMAAHSQRNAGTMGDMDLYDND